MGRHLQTRNDVLSEHATISVKSTHPLRFGQGVGLRQQLWQRVIK
jgi:hypothetical protein